MSIRLLAITLFALAATGCSGTFIAKERYEKDVNTLQDYAEALERRNQELESENIALRGIKEDAELIARENEFYEQMARQIERWLQAAQLSENDIVYANGKWDIAGDVLFASGSYIVTDKGRKILKTLASGYLGNSVHFKIVGHTDRDPVKKSRTRKGLPLSQTNLELSALRAVAVAVEFQKTGIAYTRMFVEGKGNTEPIAPNDMNAANKRKNRRVEIFVLDGVPGK